MNGEIKARWVAALRSGEYQQTKGRLTTVVSEAKDGEPEQLAHCCLGVLCDILPEVKATRVLNRLLPQARYVYGASGYGGLLPREAAQAAGLDSGDPAVNADGRETTLSILNDTFGYDFNQIADVIEAQL